MEALGFPPLISPGRNPSRSMPAIVHRIASPALYGPQTKKKKKLSRIHSSDVTSNTADALKNEGRTKPITTVGETLIVQIQLSACPFKSTPYIMVFCALFQSLVLRGEYTPRSLSESSASGRVYPEESDQFRLTLIGQITSRNLMTCS
jgi:hypothetical protein